MPQFKSNMTTGVDLTKDELAEMSTLAEEIYTHICAMRHGDNYEQNREQALKKLEALRKILGWKVP